MIVRNGAASPISVRQLGEHAFRIRQHREHDATRRQLLRQLDHR